jgi:hypothetical protein
MQFPTNSLVCLIALCSQALGTSVVISFCCERNLALANMEAGTAMPLEKRATKLEGKVTLYALPDCVEPFTFKAFEKSLEVIEDLCYNNDELIISLEGFKSFKLERIEFDGPIIDASAFSGQQCQVSDRVAKKVLGSDTKLTSCVNVDLKGLGLEGAHAFSFSHPKTDSHHGRGGRRFRCGCAAALRISQEPVVTIVR